jgi:alpha-ribazole phosphatase
LASAPPLQIYFARHGQTDASREDRFCGEMDIPLNATGLAMAAALGERYRHLRWEALYSSPKVRARQTLAPLAAAVQLPAGTEDGLQEIRYGAWDGRLSREVAETDRERYAQWTFDPAQHAPPGGETAGQVAARALAALTAIRERHPSGNVMVVSHKATIRLMLCGLLGVELKLFRARIAARVASVSMVSWHGTGPRLDVLGDISHLPPELQVDEGT